MGWRGERGGGGGRGVGEGREGWGRIKWGGGGGGGMGHGLGCWGGKDPMGSGDGGGVGGRVRAEGLNDTQYVLYKQAYCLLVFVYCLEETGFKLIYDFADNKSRVFISKY
jgi:hypothetical protein